MAYASITLSKLAVHIELIIDMQYSIHDACPVTLKMFREKSCPWLLPACLFEELVTCAIYVLMPLEVQFTISQ